MKTAFIIHYYDEKVRRWFVIPVFHFTKSSVEKMGIRLHKSGIKTHHIEVEKKVTKIPDVIKPKKP